MRDDGVRSEAAKLVQLEQFAFASGVGGDSLRAAGNFAIKSHNSAN